METINIKQLIENSSLGVLDIAKQLFPNNKLPRLALNRVIANEAVLDANQISKLALLLGVPIGDLYSSEGWKTKMDPVSKLITFTNANFKAELEVETGVTKIFDNNSIFHELVLHKPGISLNEYVELINSEILKHKTK